MKIKVYAFAVYIIFWFNYQALKAFLQTGSISKAGFIALVKLEKLTRDWEEKTIKLEDEVTVLEAEHYMRTHGGK